MKATMRADVLETIPDLLYALDLEGRVTHWNRRVEEITGLTADELLGRSAFAFFPEQDRARVAAAMAHAVETGFGEVEADFILADGSVRPFHYSGAPLRNESGAVVGLTGVGRDISERRKTEKRNTALLEIARDSSGMLEMAELLSRVQRRIAEVLPCDTVLMLHRASGEDAFRIVSHFGLPDATAHSLEGMEFPASGPFGGRVAGGACEIVDDASTLGGVMAGLTDTALLVVPLRVRGSLLGTLVASRGASKPRFDAADARLCESIAHQLALSMHAADLYKAQHEEAQLGGALARVGQELIASFGATDLVERLCRVTLEVLGCESAHTLLYVRDGAALVPMAGVGYPPEIWEAIRFIEVPWEWVETGRIAPQQIVLADVPHSSLRQLGHTLGVQSALVIPLLKGDTGLGYLTACYRSRVRTFTPMEVRIAGGIGQLASLALEHARTLEALEQASRVKSEFVATMSHELRTPLNVILGYHSLLLEGAWGPLGEEQREVIGRAESSAQELLELITKTLDLGRLESGRLSVDLDEVDVAALVAEVENETRSLFERPGLEARWSVAPGMPRLRSDARKLKVVIKNLVANAAKFTDAGTVALSATFSETEVHIAVADTGTGIDSSAMPFIFESFRQGDSSATRRHGGVGLGLYIVRRLLDMLGGSVSVESEVGRGSTFRVRLPRHA